MRDSFIPLNDNYKNMKNTIVKWLVNIAFMVTSIVIALLIGEWIVRALYKDKIVLFPRYTTDINYGDYSIRVIRPNMEFKHTSVDGVFNFKTNSRGFRSDNEIAYEKQDNEIRIICLGDSHTQGYEVNQNETYSWVTESLLRQKGLNATVINAGVSGFGNAEELVFLENEGIKYQPDFVVLGFFGNDIQDNVKSDLFAVENNSLKTKNYSNLPGVNIQNKIYKFKIVHYLGENSYLYAFMFNLVWDFYKNLQIQKSEKAIQTEYAVVMSDDYSQYELDLTEKIIERMYQFTSERNIPLIILDIPMDNMNSSIPKQLVSDFRLNSDTLFYSPDMLSEYNKFSSTHVPNGHRHISAETHNMLGNKIANFILAYYEGNNE